MNILAIRFARLGDVILLLPALSSLKRALPDARLTFLTGHRCAPIARLCPAINEVLAVDRIAMRDGPLWKALSDMTRLVRDVRKRRFDLVIDFHSFRETNLLTWLTGAPVRMGMKRYKAPYWKFCFNRPPVPEVKSLHVSAMFEKVVEATIPLLAAAPPLRGGEWLAIPDELVDWANRIGRNMSRVAFYIDAPVTERIWPAERFGGVADFVIEQFGATPLIISSVKGHDLIKRVQAASRHRDQLAVFSDITIPQLAALIASSRLFISNDTGPMHVGPGVGVPTLGLFSLGYPEHFRPIGPKDMFLRGNPIEKIEVKDVIATANKMWITGGPNLRC